MDFEAIENLNENDIMDIFEDEASYLGWTLQNCTTSGEFYCPGGILVWKQDGTQEYRRDHYTRKCYNPNYGSFYGAWRQCHGVICCYHNGRLVQHWHSCYGHYTNNPADGVQWVDICR